MSAPLVSVLVTVYNRECYLKACLDSILASSFQDFEVVVVDDQSKDSSLLIAETYAALDPRVRCFVNEKNMGDYPNRSRAASHARGKYLKYVDADDLIYPHGLEVMVRAIESQPTAALALSWNQIDPPEPYPFHLSSRDCVRSHFLGRSVLGCGPSGAIILREAFEEVGGFSGRQFVGDSELWLALAERWSVVVLPPSLVWWRQHEGQQMHLEQTRPDVLINRLKLQLEALQSSAYLDNAEVATVAAKLRQHQSRRILSMALRRRKPAIALYLFKQSGFSVFTLLRGLLKYQ